MYHFMIKYVYDECPCENVCISNYNAHGVNPQDSLFCWSAKSHGNWVRKTFWAFSMCTQSETHCHCWLIQTSKIFYLFPFYFYHPVSTLQTKSSLYLLAISFLFLFNDHYFYSQKWLLRNFANHAQEYVVKTPQFSCNTVPWRCKIPNPS